MLRLAFGLGSPRRARKPVSCNATIFEHQRDPVGVLQDRDIAERIPGDDDQIGELAFFDRPELLVATETLGGPAGRRLQCLKRGQPGIDEALYLERVPRMAMAAGVRTGGYFYSGRKRPAQAFDVVFPQMQGSFAD